MRCLLHRSLLSVILGQQSAVVAARNRLKDAQLTASSTVDLEAMSKIDDLSEENAHMTSRIARLEKATVFLKNRVKEQSIWLKGVDSEEEAEMRCELEQTIDMETDVMVDLEALQMVEGSEGAKETLKERLWNFFRLHQRTRGHLGLVASNCKSLRHTLHTIATRECSYETKYTQLETSFNRDLAAAQASQRLTLKTALAQVQWQVVSLSEENKIHEERTKAVAEMSRNLIDACRRDESKQFQAVVRRLGRAEKEVAYLSARQVFWRLIVEKMTKHQKHPTPELIEDIAVTLKALEMAPDSLPKEDMLPKLKTQVAPFIQSKSSKWSEELKTAVSEAVGVATVELAARDSHLASMKTLTDTLKANLSKEQLTVADQQVKLAELTSSCDTLSRQLVEAENSTNAAQDIWRKEELSMVTRIHQLEEENTQLRVQI